MLWLLPSTWSKGSEEDSFPLRGNWPGHPRGPVIAVAIQGTHAYCSLAEGGLAVVDLAVANETRVIARESFREGCFDVVLNGSVAYLALGSEGLGIMDVSNPHQPRLVRTIPMGTRVISLVRDGPWLAVSTMDIRSIVFVCDLTDPWEPVERGRFDSPSLAHQGVWSDGTLYLATSGNGLLMVDVSRPETPTMLGRFQLGNRHSRNLAVVGRYAFLGISGSGLSIVDVSDPEAPKEAERLPLTAVESLAVVGNHLVVWDSRAGIVQFDITQPGSPVEKGRVEHKQTQSGKPAVDGNRVWFPALEDGLVGVLIRDSEGPKPDRQVEWDAGRSADLAIEGDRVYVADGHGGLSILRLKEGHELQWLGRFKTNAPINTVAVADGRAAIISSGRVGFLDVRDPEQIRVLGQPALDAGRLVFDVALGPEHAYLGGVGLGVVALKDLPLCPVSFPAEFSGGVVDIVIHDRLLFANGGSVIRVFSLDDPGQPKLIGQHHAPSIGRTWDYAGLSLVGGFGFAATTSFGLEAVDFRDPERPKSLGNSLPWRRFGPMAPHGTNAVGTVDGVLSLLNVSVPGAVEVSSPNPDATSRGPLLTVGSTVVVADGHGGVSARGLPPALPAALTMPPTRSVLDPRLGTTLRVEASGTFPMTFQWFRDGTPLAGETSATLRIPSETPHSEGRYSLQMRNAVGEVSTPNFEVRRHTSLSWREISRIPGPARAVERDGNRAFVCLGSEGLVCYDLTPSAGPVERWRKKYSWEVADIRVRDDLAYVAGGEQGFSIVDARTGEVVGQADAPVAVGLEVFANHAYVATAMVGLVTIDISDPRHPRPVGQWVPTWAPLSLARWKNWMVGVATSSSGYLVDLAGNSWTAQPLAPFGVSARTAAGAGWAVVADGGLEETWPLARISPPGIHAFELQGPLAPTSLGRYEFPAGVQAMTVAGHWLYVANINGFAVLDYSDPSAPKLTSEVNRNWRPLDLAVYHNQLLVADADEGLITYASAAVEPQLIMANLGGSNTELRWPWGAKAVLEMADALDSKVWVPIPETAEADSWAVPAGTPSQFYRLALP